MTKTTRARALAGVLATLFLVCSFAPSVAATASDAASPAETERTAATATATTTTTTLTTTLDPVATIEARFDRWLATHGKAYACPKERAKRLAMAFVLANYGTTVDDAAFLPAVRAAGPELAFEILEAIGRCCDVAYRAGAFPTDPGKADAPA